MSDKQKKVPKLRFPGFTDEWEQRKFKNVFNYLQNNSLSRADLSEENGVVLNVHYGDILVKFGEVIDVATELLPSIIDEGILCKYQSSILQNGDIVITDAAEDETVGKCSEIRGLRDQKVLAGLHTIPVRPKEKYATGYLGYYMNADAYHNQLLPLMQGTKVSSISKSAIQETDLIFPKNVVEQQRIGEYFSNLDTLITLQQHKLKHLEKLKKGLLQKMFPRNGKKVPEIRFPGFTDEWEQRKLDDIADVRDGTHDSPKYYPQGHPFITSKNVSGGHISYDEVQYISDLDFEEINKRSRVDKNDILMGMIGTIGNIALIREKPDFAIKNVALIKDKKKIYYLYLYHYLQSSNIVKQLDNAMDGGTQKFIALNKIRSLNVFMPREGEQQLIGNYLEDLDNLITLHQRKLIHLKELKKGLCQQMFV